MATVRNVGNVNRVPTVDAVLRSMASTDNSLSSTFHPRLAK